MAHSPPLCDAESANAYIETSYKKMAAKYSGMVDLVKNPSYLQSWIDAHIKWELGLKPFFVVLGANKLTNICAIFLLGGIQDCYDWTGQFGRVQLRRDSY